MLPVSSKYIHALSRPPVRIDEPSPYATQHELFLLRSQHLVQPSSRSNSIFVIRIDFHLVCRRRGRRGRRSDRLDLERRSKELFEISQMLNPTNSHRLLQSDFLVNAWAKKERGD